MAMRAENHEGTRLGEAIAMTCAALLALVAGRWAWMDDTPTPARLVVALPIAVSVLAVSLRRREIVWTALGLCLGAGMIGFFSIGMPLLPMGLAVFAWWAQVARRSGRPVIVGDDLPFEAAGFAVAMVIVFGFPLA